MTPIEKRIVQGLIDLDKYKNDYIGALIRDDSDEEFERISKKYVVALNDSITDEEIAEGHIFISQFKFEAEFEEYLLTATLRISLERYHRYLDRVLDGIK